MIGVGIIGAGSIAGEHAKGLALLPGRAILRAVADSRLERARGFAAEHGVQRSYADYRELLADGEVHMVSVCAPNGLHARIAVDALAAGKAVLCEKPLAGSLSELDQIAAAQSRYGGKVSSVFQWRYGGGLAALRELVDEGVSGRVLWAQANVLWRRTAEYYAAASWRGSWASERGGPLLTLACHAIDALSWLMGEPRSVASFVANFQHDVEVEDTSAAVIRFRDGSMASINVTSANQDDTSRLHFICERMSALSNDTPYATTQLPWTFTSADPSVASRIQQVTRSPVTAGEANLIGVQIRDFITHLERGESAPVSITEARRSLEIVTGIYKSGLTGSPVELPIAASDPFYSQLNGGHALSRARME